MAACVNLHLSVFMIFSVPEVKENLIKLVNSFRMAWKIVRSSLVQNGE